MKDKDDLLKELKDLGIHETGRKVRTDVGQPHFYIRTTNTPRTDKGIPRQNYNSEGPAYHKKILELFIRLHTDQELGLGDDLTRDENLLFPPNMTNFYKKIKTKKYEYSSSQRRENHPEELRWNWYMAEYNYAIDDIAKKLWLDRICIWYFIIPEDIDLWTYKEWSWAYVTQVGGHQIRTPKCEFKLLYTEYAKGTYGKIKYDDQGNVIFNRKS